MKIYKITEASAYLGVSINTLKTLANNGKIKSFKTTGDHRSLGLWDGDEQISQELFFQKPDWEKFMLALFEFASTEEKENGK